MVLIGDWLYQTYVPDNKCKCAPYYWFDSSSKTCLPIKNRLPHCVVGAELYGDLKSDLGLDGFSDVCALCEPGYVLEPWQDLIRDKALNCIPKLKHCEETIEEVTVASTDYSLGDIS